MRRTSCRCPTAWASRRRAAIPVNYVTAYATGVLLPHTRRGETVLVHAAAGGVGIATLQLLRDVGAVAIGTASASKHDAIRAHGAAHAIDYRTQDTRAEVERITGRAGGGRGARRPG